MTIWAPVCNGTVGDNDLALFDGIKMKGTWTLKFLDFDDTLTGVCQPGEARREGREAASRLSRSRPIQERGRLRAALFFHRNTRASGGF